MKALRRIITKKLPPQWQNKVQRIAREVDCLLGIPYIGKQPAIVCVFHVGRSGSTVLGDYMDNRADVYWDGELYERANKNRSGHLGGIEWETWTKKQFRIARRRIYGFEVKPLADQHLVFLGNTLLDDYLAMIDRIGVTHYVILRRENILRRMISQHVGTITGTRHVEKTINQMATKVTLDVDNFSFGFGRMKPLLDCMQDVDNVYRHLNNRLNRKPLLELSYEEDILRIGPQLAYEKMCNFLSLTPAVSGSRLRRTNPYPISDIVENYSELEEYLKGTAFEWMLTH